MLGKKKEDKEVKKEYIRPNEPAYMNEWIKAGLSVVENDFGVVFTRKVHYPLHYQHGHYKLKDFHVAIEKWKQAKINHPFSIVPEEKVVFFDTETTGLKGVGSQIFIIGLLEVHEREFQLNQYVLADPAHEAALLFESKFWQQGKTVVTYNGKSFDWPMLETRWTLHHKILPKLQKVRQVDLLHSTKRIWKNHLDQVKLTKVEEEKLGFQRKNDIPGYLAPIIYRDAITSGNANTLMKVLQHNEWDLLSLVTLYIHSTDLLLESKLEESAIPHTNIGKWYGDLKEVEVSEEVLRTVTEHFHENETGLAYYYLAFQQKRNKQFDDSIQSFIKSIHQIDEKKQLKAFEQLAILYEHQKKDYENALKFSQKGMELIRKGQFLKQDQRPKQLSTWERRVHRILNKMDKSYTISQVNAMNDKIFE